MFIPSAKSKFSLISLLIVALLLFAWSHNSRVKRKQKFYSEKLAAAKLMAKAEKVLKNYRLEKGFFIDEVNDPNKTGLIGEKYTQITTEEGKLESKLTSLNPNFAAVIVDFFKKAGLKEDDLVAVSYTGSFPALNIAVMSAAKILGLNLKIISSPGASMFGATDPDFTWLDMENLLYRNQIFPYKSMAASIGGGEDNGRGLSKQGRDLLKNSILRNNIPLIVEDSLLASIDKKMELFSKDKISLYVNVGGGISSLGSSLNGELIETGFHRNLPVKKYHDIGTMILYAKKGIPIIHLENIAVLAQENKLLVSPVPLPKPGNGKVFIEDRYSIAVAAISLIIMFVLILIVILFDHKQQKFSEQEIIKIEEM